MSVASEGLPVTRMYGSGSSEVSTHVFLDPVSLIWTWRGYADDESERGELFTERRNAVCVANAWAREQVKRRVADWSRALSEVGQ